MSLEYAQPRLVLSRCLGFEECRYNGTIIENEFINHLKEYVDVVSVCPECGLGMSVPRSPIIVLKDAEQNRLYQPDTEKDLTEEMLAFSETYLGEVMDIDGYILTARSPSCGFYDTKLYDPQTKRLLPEKTQGIFAEIVSKTFPYHPKEDDERLADPELRHLFLMRIFLMADFRAVFHTGEIEKMLDFHSRHKLLFMALDQDQMRAMGHLLGQYTPDEIVTVFFGYQEGFYQIINKPLTRGNMINALMHCFGGFKQVLSGPEKESFLSALDKYRDGQFTLTEVLNILKDLSYQYDNQYLLGQSILQPYPEEVNSL